MNEPSAMQMLIQNVITQLVLTGILALVGIYLHNVVYARVFAAFGDKTAREARRLSFNPIKNLGIFGLISMLVSAATGPCVLGFGRLVPVQAKPKASAVIVSTIIASLANIILAVICAALAAKYMLNPPADMAAAQANMLSMMFQLGGGVNITLAVMHFIPLPPFDFGRLWLLVLPEATGAKLLRYETYIGFIILVVLLASGAMLTLTDASVLSLQEMIEAPFFGE